MERSELTRRDVYWAVTAAILTAAAILFVVWIVLWVLLLTLSAS